MLWPIHGFRCDLLWPAAAKMVDALPKPTPSQAPKLQQAFFGPKSKKRQAKQKRAPVRLRANPSESPDAIQSRVDALASVLQELGAIRPSGRMSGQLEDEWAGSCVRLAQRLVTSAEPVTVLNALKTHQELRSYMAKRERQGEPERVDLDSFLHSSSTTAPSRALNSLKWLNKHGHLGWDVVDLTCPASIRPRSKRGQAAVISPPMLMFLEEQAEQMCRSGEDRWSCLLGSWMVAAGCMRYRHLTRSTPRRVSMSTFHATCHRGKQRFTRKGFDFSLPGEFASGFSWSRQWLIRYEALSEEQRKTAGLCFNKDGIPWTLSDVTTEAQYLFANYLTDASALTTYSFRRWGPTFGQLLKFSPVELNALGDWQERGATPKEASMPLHYSGAKYATSMRMKHLLMLCIPEVCEFEAWEVVPATVLRSTLASAREALDRPINRDAQTWWAQPMSANETKEQLVLSKSLLDKASQRVYHRK